MLFESRRYGENVREHLLLTYGHDLLGHSGLWQVSFFALWRCTTIV